MTKIEDHTTSESGDTIESRISQLRVKARKMGLNGASKARISWDDFSSLVSRLCARVEEQDDAVWVMLYTPGGSVRAVPATDVANGTIDMGVEEKGASETWTKPAGLDSGAALRDA